MDASTFTQNGEQIHIKVLATLLVNFKTNMNTLFIIKVKILVLNERSYKVSPAPPHLCCLLNLEWLSNFEHTIQSPFGIHSWNHTKPLTKFRCYRIWELLYLTLQSTLAPPGFVVNRKLYLLTTKGFYKLPIFLGNKCTMLQRPSHPPSPPDFTK